MHWNRSTFKYISIHHGQEMNKRFTRRNLVFFLLMILIVTSCAMPVAQHGVLSPPADTVPTIGAKPSPTVPPIPTETKIVVPTATLVPTNTPEVIGLGNILEVVPLGTLVGHTGEVTDVAFSPNGELVASSSTDGTVRLWRISDGSLLYVLEGHTNYVRSVAFSPDGNLLASGSNDRTVRIWQVSDGTLIRTISSSFMGRVLRVIFSPDGSLFAAADHQCFVQLRQTRSGILLRTLAQPKCVARWGGTVSSWGLAFSSDGSQLTIGESRPCCGGSLYLWPVEEITAPQLIRGHNMRVRDLVYSADGSMLAIAFEGSPVFWLTEAVDGSIIRTFEGHTYRVNSVVFSPDDTLLASGSRDQKVRLWNVSDGELLHTLEGHEDEVNNVAFSPDGSLIASSSDDDTIILWGLITSTMP